MAELNAAHAAFNDAPAHGDRFPFAQNYVDRTLDYVASQFGQEFAGATFSPDFRTLYVNIQSGSGYSIAIWGPWGNGPF